MRELIYGDGAYCDKHRLQKARDRKRSRIVTDTAPWKALTDQLKACGNVICQYVDTNGIRCKAPAWGAHHIIAPETREDLALDQRNLVRLCRDHHNRVTFSEQGTASARYIPTRYVIIRGVVIEEGLDVLPGAGVTPEEAKKLWTLANTAARCT